MKEKRKELAIAIIILFIVASVVPSISGNDDRNINIYSIAGSKEFTGEVTTVNSNDACSNNLDPLFSEDWIHYDDGTNVDSIGLTSGGSFEWGIRLTPTELTGCDGENLTTVKFHHGYVDNPAPMHSGNIYVYEAGTPTAPGAQIPSATTPWSHTGSDWVELTLTNPVTINASQDLWITVDVTHAAGEYPAGCGPGPQVPGKGGWITMDGVTWDEISEYDLDYNWNLWAGIDVEPPGAPDLDCDGTLSFIDVTPGAIVEGEFTVENSGESESLLDWEIESYPEWGTFTFNPDSGEDLTPEDGEVTVDVEIVAPENKTTEFEGEIKIVNSEDPDDFCIIDVSLTTPVSQPSLILQFLELLAERFPIIAKILSVLF